MKSESPTLLAWGKWLGGEGAEREELQALLLKPYPAARMQAYPVSKRVNSPRDDDEAMIEEVAGAAD